MLIMAILLLFLVFAVLFPKGARLLFALGVLVVSIPLFIVSIILLYTLFTH